MDGKGETSRTNSSYMSEADQLEEGADSDFTESPGSHGKYTIGSNSCQLPVWVFCLRSTEVKIETEWREDLLAASLASKSEARLPDTD